MSNFDALIGVLPAWSEILGGQILLIVIPASVAFLILYRWPGKRFSANKIQLRVAPPETVRREMLYSLSTALVFALNGFAIYLFMSNGWTLIYGQISDYGWFYSALSLSAAIILHDAYFYWTHRLMHLPRFYRAFHHLHHESHSPSPWAAYAFAPLEAVVQALFLTILVFVMPLHVWVIYLFMIHMIVRNVIGHSGFEFFPSGTASHRFLGLLTTNTHHDLHHSCGAENYGLYFTWWDRLCGTENPAYRETFDRVTRGHGNGERSAMQ